jgi:mannose-6-phosphate isomerase-like protein (cupin superfamily)
MNTVTDKRPWGHFERFTLNEVSTVKLIHVNAGKRLSLQYHTKRSEFWKVISGKVKVTLDESSTVLSQGETITIPTRSAHRIEAINDSIILEISIGEFDEEDIIRLQDDYNRATEPSTVQKE